MIPFSSTMRSTSGIVNVTGSNFMTRGSLVAGWCVAQAASSASPPPVPADRVEIGEARGHPAVGPERADLRGIDLVEDLLQLVRGDRLPVQAVEFVIHRLLDLRGGMRRAGRGADHEQVRVLGAGVVGER